MKVELILTLVVFWSLVGWTMSDRKRAKKMISRTRGQWLLDLTGLTIHGVVVPLFQSFIIYKALGFFFADTKGSWELPAVVSFSIAFFVVDYAYYWNHRFLHRPRIWRFHAVHHSGDTFDVFTTSRNSAITTFLILYVWVNGIFLFLLKEPGPYVWGIALSAVLDIARHSGFASWPNSAPFSWLISPRDHAWHHSPDTEGVNFGGNFSIWDKLHGTYQSSNQLPERIGTPAPPNLWKAFWRGEP